MFSSESSEWGTPQEFFDELDREFHFTLDPCATKENAKCERYYTKNDNGLRMKWGTETVFCNPPYGREINKWVLKCHMAAKNGATVVMLIPARTDTIYFHEYIYKKAKEIRFIRGRLKFVNGDCKNSAPFPSMVVIF